MPELGFDGCDPTVCRAGGAVTRRPWTYKKTLAKERRCSAIHEAGHYVVARHLGVCRVGAVVWPRLPVDTAEAPGTKTYRGSCHLLGLDRAHLSYRKRMRIGCAGTVAALAWDANNGDGRLDQDYVHDLMLGQEGLSDTDLAFMWQKRGHPSGDAFDHAWKVAKLLMPGTGILWGPLLRVARILQGGAAVASSQTAGRLMRRHLHENWGANTWLPEPPLLVEAGLDRGRLIGSRFLGL